MSYTDDGWHSFDSVQDVWFDAPVQNLMIDDLLQVAKEQVIAYAPPLAPGAAVPTRYRLAQIMQARALWQSTEANSSDQIGSDGFTVTVYPMDWTVKNILRPKRGVPIVG